MYFLPYVIRLCNLCIHLNNISTHRNVLGSEHQRLLEAFTFLSENQAWKDFVFPVCEESRRIGITGAKAFFDVLPLFMPPDHWEAWPEMDSGERVDEQSIQYPIIVSLVGSTTSVFKVRDKSKYRIEAEEVLLIKIVHALLQPYDNDSLT